MSEKVFLSQFPNSNTNPTPLYRVIEFGEWLEYCDGVRSFFPTYGRYQSLNDAIKRQEELNGGEVRDEDVDTYADAASEATSESGKQGADG